MQSRTLPRRTPGFSLIEIAVVILIVTLLLGAVLVPLTTQVQQRRIGDTQRALDDIKEALIGFAIANGYLPCPAISATNGLEDRTGGVCTANKRQGYLPWVTLGVSKLDAWGHLFRYSVTLAYASSSIPFAIGAPSDITIQTRDAAGTLINLTNLNIIPVVVLSHGNNGYGAVDDQGIPVKLPDADWPANYPDENTNATATTTFVSRVPQGARPILIGGGEFDDIVTWISPNILFNRMVSAGKLP